MIDVELMSKMFDELKLEKIKLQNERMRLENKLLGSTAPTPDEKSVLERKAERMAKEAGAADGNPKADFPVQRALVSFESGHYKMVKGQWKGDSVWTHFIKSDGGQVHINKDKVEYIETWKA